MLGWRGLPQHLGVDLDSRPAVYMRVFESADINSLNYWLELIFSAGIATLGLVLNSPAVVIGAMLISPLMGPILAAGLGLASGDLYLGLRALLNILLSIGIAVGFSAGIVWLLPFQSPTGEILARTEPNLLDLGVALLSGLAGSLVVCRGGGGGGVTALPGVAIAVALMPPLCTVGFGVGSGLNWVIISGAGLLFLTNLAAITAAAFVTFFSVRMDAPEVQPKIDSAIRRRSAGDRMYRFLHAARPAFGTIGHLRWRVLMLVGVLVALFLPLRESFVRLRDEANARTAIADVIRRLAPADTIVNRQVDVRPSQLTVRLVVTAPIESRTVQSAERELVRRTGKEVSMSVRKVAGEEELALLRERLRTPSPVTVPPIGTVRAELLARVERPLREAWPSRRATLEHFEIGFTPVDMIVRVRYASETVLDEPVQETIANVLRGHLDVDELQVVLERSVPEPEPPKPAVRRNRRVK
jgi:uncharacterized hydrophobic protein (TIGR00271 family)